jgi:simple sugar transport system ATP-binding protein
VVANDGIDLTVEDGEIHALLGENGAGKTTLMNVLYGLYHADEGEILIDGRPVRFASPGDAIKAGIGMVHQHFMLIPVFTVAENVILGDEPTGMLGLLDQARARSEVRELSRRFGLAVDPDAIVEDLPVGIQQRVEIIKALLREARLLILDEPTAVLTPQETEDLFAVMRSLRASGHSILFITHKLKEVLPIADRITVLRLGKVVGSTVPAESDEQQLASMMVGRSVLLRVAKAPAEPGEMVLEVDDLTVLDERGHTAVDHLSLEVRAGEILAIAGVQGNGQTELVEALTGLLAPTGGTIRVAGRPLEGARPRAVLRAGVAHVPEDRVRDGLVASFSVAENLVLNTYDLEPFARGPVMNAGAIEVSAKQRAGEFDIRTPSVKAPVGTLSGGNQQKVIIARELTRPIKLLVASQPTRGLDVGSIEYVHRRIVEARDQGDAVLIVSSELDEVLALADRIVVMYRGRIVGERPGGADRDEIGLLMAGSAEEQTAEAGDGGEAVG